MTFRKFEIANKKLRNNNFNQSIKLYEELINSCPFYPFYYKNLAEAYESINKGLKSYINLVQASILLGDKESLEEANIHKLWSRKIASTKDLNSDKALVIVPVYNSFSTIEKSLSSVFNQTHKSILVVAIDDGSSDESVSLLKKLKKKYSNLIVLISPVNQGTYSSINLVLRIFSKLDFSYFCIHGADDLMHKSKIELQIRSICNNNYLGSIAGYKRISIDGKCLGYQEIGHSMVVYKKEVFEKIGYYDDTRFGGDSEYISRFKSKFGTQKLNLIKKPLTEAYYGINNISHAITDKSEIRKAYADSFKIKHKLMKKSDNWYMSYQFSNNFVEYSKKKYYGSRIICGVATIESRSSALFDMVNSILNQVDKLIIYQNGYKKINDFLNHEKIEVISSIDTGSDMGDAGKYYCVDNYDNCYYLSLDDDLIYPPDYVENLIQGLNYYNNEVILSYHGRTLKPDAHCYYKDYQEYFRCLGALKEDRFVHFGGTGVMGFHTSAFNVKYEMLKKANMADIWIGLLARKQLLPIVVRKHAIGWIKCNDKVNLNETIYKKYEHNHGFQNKLLVGFETNIIIEYK